MNSSFILVLGSSGFLGQELCLRLLNAGYSVRGFDRSLPSLSYIANHGKFEQVKSDFDDHSQLIKALEGIDVVYHLISTSVPATSNVDPATDCKANVYNTIKLLDFAVNEGVKKIVFISSGGTVYGRNEGKPLSEDDQTDPICAYGIAKLAIEKYLRLYYELHGLNYQVLRVSNPYGGRQPANSGQGVISVFIDRALKNEPIEIWGDGRIVRDFIYIDDVIDAMIRIMEYSGKYNIFNIGSGEGYSLLDLTELISEELGQYIEVRFHEGRKVDIPYNVLDVRRAKGEFVLPPTTLINTGISKVVSYRREIK